MQHLGDTLKPILKGISINNFENGAAILWRIGSKRIWTISGFHIPSEFFSQLSLIFVIRIPCDADQLDAVSISESSIEITAVFLICSLQGADFLW